MQASHAWERPFFSPRPWRESASQSKHCLARWIHSAAPKAASNAWFTCLGITGLLQSALIQTPPPHPSSRRKVGHRNSLFTVAFYRAGSGVSSVGQKQNLPAKQAQKSGQPSTLRSFFTSWCVNSPNARSATKPVVLGWS